MIKAIIFDFDGVITDSKPMHLKSFNDAVSGLGIKVTKKEFDSYFGVPALETFNMVFKKNKVKANAEKYRKLKNKIYLKYADKVKLNKGAKTLVRTLSKKYKLAITSNTPVKEIRLLVKKHKIEKCFKLFLGWESTKKHKPCPEPYLKAARKLGAKPKECIIVEDSPTGLEAAKRAKIKSIGLLTTNPRKNLKKADFIVKDLGSTKRILEIIKGI